MNVQYACGLQLLVYYHSMEMQTIDINETLGTEQSQQLNKIINFFLDPDNSDNAKIQQALSSLFDLILWAQKRNSDLLKTVLDMQLLSLIVQKYSPLIRDIINGFTLLLGNAKQNGQIVQYLLQNRLGDRVIKQYIEFVKQLVQFQEDEHLHMVASFLKAYHKHFTATSYPYFIYKGQCLLISICCKFYNCSEEITRTTIMNISMTLLKQSFITQVIYHKRIAQSISSWCRNMCRLFRNELKDFDQQLLITEEEESQFIINSINDKTILWEDLSELSNGLFTLPFYEEIVLPLVIGSLNTNAVPLFTLKFALFIINKLVKTITNLGLLNKLGQLLFTPMEIRYNDNQLGTAVLTSFHLKRLLDDQLGEQVLDEEDDEHSTFQGINLFFMNILRSKDSRFLQCICVLITNILKIVKQDAQSLNYFIKQLGFGLNGSMVLTISSILITQFSAMHSIEIIKIICCSLVYIQASKFLVDDTKNRFIYMYKAMLNETIKMLEKNKQAYASLAQTFQYDARIINSKAFSFTPQIKSDNALLFNNQIIQNEMLPFYQQLPQTNQYLMRYHIVKALLLRKLGCRLIQECIQDKALQIYLQILRNNEAKLLKPGEYVKLPIKCNSYRCKLLDSKVQIPNCLLLQDSDNLIVGYFQSMQIKIIMNFKFKHVTANVFKKKDKIYAEFIVKRFDYQKTQTLVKFTETTLKGLQINLDYFKIKKEKIIGKEISNIFQILKRSLYNIPQVSLI